jgi:hypothetical protein
MIAVTSSSNTTGKIQQFFKLGADWMICPIAQVGDLEKTTCLDIERPRDCETDAKNLFPGDPGFLNGATNRRLNQQKCGAGIQIGC